MAPSPQNHQTFLASGGVIISPMHCSATTLGIQPGYRKKNPGIILMHNTGLYWGFLITSLYWGRNLNILRHFFKNLVLLKGQPLGANFATVPVVGRNFYELSPEPTMTAQATDATN